MTNSGMVDISEFQQIQDSGSSVSTEPARQRNIRLQVQTDPTKVTNPIFSSLPDEEDFREIVADFIPQVEAKFEEMLKAIETKDFDALEKLGHWLKGAGGTVGFDEYIEPSDELEVAARARDLGACEACFSLLLAMSQRIVIPQVAAK